LERGALSRLYVSSKQAGAYYDVGETDDPLKKGAEEHLNCPHSVAVFGQTGSSGVAYCFMRSLLANAFSYVVLIVGFLALLVLYLPRVGAWFKYMKETHGIRPGERLTLVDGCRESP
jgi:hypothetical protein